MLTLIVWATLNGTTMLTVQATAPLACNELRQAMLTQPGVTRAMCAGSPETIANAIEAGRCAVFQEGRGFVNFICER